ncbi:nuclear transport factor 2 family protein [Nocardia sp. MDA0666]|uniref:nuclear transport factor 2 family protein n=1 Tax=Nocardia sp. MDA0666 TaxID=2135448 RepID=UPI000D135CD7|nr:nuclear transport factor 2 family protein [Nocardia sp. MDA0666]PSR66487.1 nuclear transport factor 2 family protein [Nocardia sp. MDA0666]
MTSFSVPEADDRVQITSLVSRYYRAVDEQRVDRALVDAVFTEDGRWVGPTGKARVGREVIADQQAKAVSMFRATHHVTSDYLVDVDGDTARLRANLTAMHLWGAGATDPAALESHFLAGGVFDGTAVRTEEGWRLSELTLRIVWRTGALPIHVDPESL